MKRGDGMETKKRRLTWFDWFIILIVLALAAGTVFKFFYSGYAEKTSAETEFVYQMRTSGTMNFVTDALQVGDVVYDGSLNTYVGVIEGIEVAPAETELTRSDGTTATGTDESRCDIILTLRASGQKLDDGYRLGDYKISDTLEDVFYTKYALWYGVVISID